ncbi:DODA-type extradiol aromatic ring-opening family dioxygenase [Acidocella sp.]|uniref:DODA-type extradiol aromatic ring-opening family dioxygenase n=1 Tax=Acidocella sp. TaxID=50710 RepID=UPI003CFCB6B4
MLPTLFISHGSPMTILEDTPARRFLESLGGLFPRPRAILSISAHWETEAPAVNDPPANETIYDFYGFPQEMYHLTYPAPVAHGLAERVRGLLAAADLPCGTDKARGLDHGTWVPLKLAYPDADIPVIQLSVQSQLGARHHVNLGAALKKLREEDVLVFGSGTFTHDLRRFRFGRAAIDAPETPDVTAFSTWMDEAIMAGDVNTLAEYRRLAPYAVEEHPTEEHLLPLHVAMGAAGPGMRPEKLHSSVEYGFMRMDAYAFG